MFLLHLIATLQVFLQLRNPLWILPTTQCHTSCLSYTHLSNTLYVLPTIECAILHFLPTSGDHNLFSPRNWMPHFKFFLHVSSILYVHPTIECQTSCASYIWVIHFTVYSLYSWIQHLCSSYVWEHIWCSSYIWVPHFMFTLHLNRPRYVHPTIEYCTLCSS